MLDRNPFTQDLLSIELIDSVVSIAVIIKLNKTKSLFDQDVRLPSISLEESFEVLLSAP